MHIRADIIVDRPIRDVFACAADPACWPDWLSGPGRTVRGYERPLEVGTVFVLEEDAPEYGRESLWEVIEYAPPRALGCRRVSEGAPATMRQIFESVTGSTRITLVCDVEDGAPFTLGPEVEHAMVTRLSQALTRLKQRLEEHPAAGDSIFVHSGSGNGASELTLLQQSNDY
jgi:uncharacterized protein YndB with AHSA1/START domain